MNKGLEWLLGMAAFQAHTRPVQERDPGANLYRTAEEAWNLQTTIHGELAASDRGLVVVANHPRGLLEMLIAGGWLEEATGRPVRFMVNRMAGEVFPALKAHIVGIDNMGRRGPARSAFNRAALAEALAFLREGGVLYVCPAGQVASWRLRSPEGWFRSTDHPWHPTFVALAREADVPIQLLHLSGSTRLRYRMLRLFGVVFGRIMNFREFIAGANAKTRITVADRVDGALLAQHADAEISRLCRDRVFSCAEHTGSS